jgi:hypothetical protein
MISLDYEPSGLEQVSRRQLKQILLEGVELTAKRWRKRYLHRHFGTHAVSRYGYRKRGPTYNRRKKREKKHTRPLEHSGSGKDEALANEKIKTGGTSKAVWAKVTLPRVFNFTSPRGVKMADEIRAVRSDEMLDLSTFLVKHIDKRLAALGGKRGNATIK